MAGMHGRGGSRPPFNRHGPSPGEDPARDKAMRSIFVANIAFETTEEQLRTVLSEVGPVVNLKLIYDPATGKPRGFGFCEYEDAETAMSAVRNLAGRELNGRPLRIDSASNAPGGEGVKSSAAAGPGGPIEPPTYGAPVPPENAPEVITKAVASLPPEQMFELMKQMKWFIQHNPQEARQLLLHNPQLAYALLQAQVVMKIVDVEAAQKLLHRAPRGPTLSSGESRGPPPPSHEKTRPPPPVTSQPSGGFRERGEHFHSGPPPPQRGGERGYGGPPPPAHEHYGGRMMGHPPPHGGPRGGSGGPYSGPPPPRAGPHGGEPGHMRPHPGSSGGGGGRPPSRGDQDGMSPQDQEKAALIMQVLSLTDEQIRVLPPDQQSSILKLKEQIARTS